MEKKRGRGHKLALKVVFNLAIIGLVSFAIYTVFSQKSSLSKGIAVLKGANYWLIGVALMFEIASYLGYVYFFHSLCRPSAPDLSFRRAAHIQITAYGIGNITPGGGIGGLYFYYKGLVYNGCGKKRAVSYILIAILISGSVLSLFFALGAVMVNLAGWLSPGYGVLVLAGAALMNAIFLTGYILLLRPGGLVRLLERHEPLAERLLKGRAVVTEQVKDIILDAGTGLSRLAGDRGRLIRVVMGAVAYWGLDAMCLFCCFQAFQRGISPWVLLLGYGIGMATMIIPITQGGLGTVEGSLILVYMAMGIAPEVALSAVLVYRLYSFWISIPLGLLGLWRFPRKANGSELATEPARVPT